MTLNNLLDRSLLGLHRYERDVTVRDMFGLSDEDLTQIRNGRKTIDKILRAASILAERLNEANVDSTVIPAQLTKDNLAMLVDDGSCVSSPPVRTVGTALKRRFYARKKEVARETGLSPSYTQLLREEIGLYSGDLYEAKRNWPSLRVSPADWLKDVRIPVRIGLEVAVLLGIYYAHGAIIPHSKDKKVDTRFELYGRNCDFEFYERLVEPLIRKIHNIIPKKPSAERIRARSERNPDFTYNVPSYEIHSLALSSWLQNGVGMSNSWDDREVPNLENEEQKLGFFKGLVAGLGNIYVYPDRSRMRIETRNLRFIEGLKRLSEELGFSPTIGGNGTILNYSKSDILKMRANDVFINPYHLDKLRTL